MWASFNGGVPLCMIKDAGNKLTDKFLNSNSIVL